MLLIRNVIGRAKHSPLFARWCSYGARATSFLAILPFLLLYLNAAELALWFLFLTIAGLQLVIDSGLSATFMRAISYAMGGAKEIGDLRDPDKTVGGGQPNLDLVSRIVATMGKVYIWLALGWIAILLAVGTVAVSGLVSQLENPGEGWLAWGVLIITSAFRLYGFRFVAYLMGVNEVAVLRRWEAMVWLIIIPLAVAGLMLGGGLLAVVLATQIAAVLGVLINRHLTQTVQAHLYGRLVKYGFQQQLFSALWSRAWRSAVGVFMTTGLVQLTGVFYAQIGAVQSVGAYLLALNLIRFLMQFSQAPFYSKLPLLARLRSEGKLAQQQVLAERGMRWSFWCLAAGIVGVSFVGEPVAEYYRSQVGFVSIELWMLMGFAAFLERYGAMHLQLYSTTNHIVWHIANGITGVVYLISVMLLFEGLGVYAFPIAQILSYLAFYDWYAARMSYNAFRIPILRYEMKTSIIPFAVLCIAAAVIAIMPNT